jgi:hypothetical protein
MKLTKQELVQIIKEELDDLLGEEEAAAIDFGPRPKLDRPGDAAYAPRRLQKTNAGIDPMARVKGIAKTVQDFPVEAGVKSGSPYVGLKGKFNT